MKRILEQNVIKIGVKTIHNFEILADSEGVSIRSYVRAKVSLEGPARYYLRRVNAQLHVHHHPPCHGRWKDRVLLLKPLW